MIIGIIMFLFYLFLYFIVITILDFIWYFRFYSILGRLLIEWVKYGIVKNYQQY